MSYRWGATVDEWLQFSLLDLTEDLLPVISKPNAKISENSSLKKLGKTPSIYNQDGLVVGIKDWTQLKSNSEDVERWSSIADYGICIQTRRLRAFDIDVPDSVISGRIHERIEIILGHPLPTRYRDDSGKILLAFFCDGNFGKRKVDVEGGVIEFLANGNQFVAAGTHTDGARYKWVWRDGGAIEFPTLTREETEDVWGAIVEEFGISGETQSGGVRVKGEHINCDDPLVPFLRLHPNFIGEEQDGKILIVCPFKDQHTSDSGDSETAYFPKGTYGYDEGHFVCMHAHCRGRTNAAFEQALGYYDESFECFDVDETKMGCAGSDDAFKTIGDSPVGAKYKLISGADYLKRPKPQWIIKDFLPKADIGALYGESGAGKTFVALDMALAIARGESWLGRDTVKGRVVYIAAEGAGGLRNRLEAYCIANEITLDGLPIQIIPAAPNFLDSADCLEVAKSIRAGSEDGIAGCSGAADVIFVDTLAQVTIGGNENAAEDMGKAIANCKNIHVATGAMVIVVHHSGKDASKGLRGSSVLKGALDVNVEVYRDERDTSLRRMKLEKLKDGEDGDEWEFRLSTVELSCDDPLDEQQTSTVVQWLGPVKKNDTRKLTDPKRNIISGKWRIFVMKTYKKMEKNEDGSVNEQLLLAVSCEDAKKHFPQTQLVRLKDNIRRAIFEMKMQNIIVNTTDDEVVMRQ